MANRSRLKDTLAQAEADGEVLAAAMYKDLAEEDGLIPIQPLKKGQWVMIYTATHYYCGQFLGEDHEYYYLAPNSSQVFVTGTFARFYKDGTADDCETVPTLRRVRKGPVVVVDDWPLNRAARKVGGS